MKAINGEISSRVYYAFEEPEGVLLSGPPPASDALRLAETPDPISTPKTGFWRRQFEADVTRGQKKFDSLFGVILPAVCIFFDPIVFRSGFPGDNLLGRFAPFAYLLSFAAVMATMAWLLWGDRLRWVNVALSGLFAVSFLSALAIGIYLLPFSLIGLVILIGALGFTPLFSSFVFLRNSVRAFRAARGAVDREVLFPSFALAATLSAVIPYLFNLL